LHHFGDGDAWRDGKKEMDMIPSDSTCDNLDVQRACHLSDKIPDSVCDLSMQYGIPVFGYPTDVVFEIIEGVRCGSIVFHTTILASYTLYGFKC
jgi:hypothetical protein